MNRVLEKAEFKLNAEKERRRTHRTGSEFSIMVFNTGGSKNIARHLIESLCRRMRCYDDIGWLNNEHLAVILPETSFETASAIAENICTNGVSQYFSPLKYMIFTYPGNGSNRGNRDFIENLWGRFNPATKTKDCNAAAGSNPQKNSLRTAFITAVLKPVKFYKYSYQVIKDLL